LLNQITHKNKNSTKLEIRFDQTPMAPTRATQTKNHKNGDKKKKKKGNK